MEWLILVLAIVVIVVAAVGIVRQRSASLSRRFGPEYDRAVEEHGSRRAGESELRRLEQRRKSLDLHDLAPAERTRYAEQWRAVQLHFVDQPEATVAAADALIVKVMGARGYPFEDADERTAMVVADYPDLADDYRTAHAIQQRSDRGEVSLDELRESFQHYRALFSRLLEDAAGDGDDRFEARDRETLPDAGIHSGEHDRAMPDAACAAFTWRTTQMSADRTSIEHEAADIEDPFDTEPLGYQTRWDDIQAGFVDEPTRSVAEADALVTEVIDEISAGLASARADLEEPWSDGDEVSTEVLRQAFQRYRSFFQRLVSV